MAIKDEIVKKIVAGYKAGKNAKTIGEEVKLPFQTVAKVARDKGIIKPKKKSAAKSKEDRLKADIAALQAKIQDKCMELAKIQILAGLK